LDAIRDNLIFSLERWPEAGRRVAYALDPSTFAPYLEESLSREDSLENLECPQLHSPIKGTLELQLFGHRLKIKGDFSVQVELTCHRCLGSFPGRIEDEIEDVLDLVEGPVDGDLLEEMALAVVNNQFDLTPLLCECFWLSWPIKVLCRPDCQGLCLTCGNNLNTSYCSCGVPQRIRH
jgi:uncharacterized metal-binding protein YceD (DUF177 family)